MSGALNRKSPLRAKSKSQAKSKPKKCKACKSEYMPANSLQKACSPRCALALVGKEKEKRAAAEKRKSRVQLRKAKEQLKTIGQLTQEAQKEFNRYIRERDWGKPCICCGQYEETDFFRTGGQWDAGHFLSVGSHPELRFEESNCHRQLKSCNAGEGKYAAKGRTVRDGYVVGIVERIGAEKVAWLKGPHEMPRYRHDDLRAIRDKYRKLANQLKRERERGCS